MPDNTPPKPTTSSGLQHRLHLLLDSLRHQLAHLDALPQLTLLGLIAAIASAGIIVAFRLAIDMPLITIFGTHAEDFESLPRIWYALLPLLGGITIGLLLHYIPKHHRQVSVGHVLDRLHNHQGKLPAYNWAVQFVGGTLALLTGQSMGREGPAVHLGAGAASQLGQWLRLPNNCLRTLIGCGVASAIAASFNTPMAGVIFSMEVILMEYTIAGFIPVMMASVTGAVIGQMVFGHEPAFSITALQMNTLRELPIIAMAGLIIAFFAAAIIRLQLFFNQQHQYSVLLRLSAAGAMTGLLAFWYPQILGVGYDTIESAMQGEFTLQLLLGILFAKILATTISGGLGMPGGLIGPMLFIGAILGGAIGIVANTLTPDSGASPSFYVLLGMGAMMAAVINAPLAALITVFELTHNPNTIFPTMLIIVIAVIATRQIFRCDGIFIAQLEANGFNLSSGPIRQALDRIGVRSVMESRFLRCPHQLTVHQLQQRLQQHPQWLVIDDQDKDKYLLAAADVSAFLNNTELDTDSPLKLRSIPGRQWQLKPIHQQASLFEAQQQLQQFKADALYVERQASPWLSPVIGIITQEQIDNYYRV
jgi:chloride channel protein, CIC family